MSTVLQRKECALLEAEDKALQWCAPKLRYDPHWRRTSWSHSSVLTFILLEIMYWSREDERLTFKIFTKNIHEAKRHISCYLGRVRKRMCQTKLSILSSVSIMCVENNKSTQSKWYSSLLLRFSWSYTKNNSDVYIIVNNIDVSKK